MHQVPLPAACKATVRGVVGRLAVDLSVTYPYPVPPACRTTLHEVGSKGMKVAVVSAADSGIEFSLLVQCSTSCLPAWTVSCQPMRQEDLLEHAARHTMVPMYSNDTPSCGQLCLASSLTPQKDKEHFSAGTEQRLENEQAASVSGRILCQMILCLRQPAWANLVPAKSRSQPLTLPGHLRAACGASAACLRSPAYTHSSTHHTKCGDVCSVKRAKIQHPACSQHAEARAR